MEFGSFDSVCRSVALPLCPLVGKTQIEPSCFSRNLEIAGSLIFQPSTLVIHIGAFIMTIIMLYHINTKYTAVGRKEIAIFFYFYLLSIVFEFITVSGIVPLYHDAYKYIVALHVGFTSATVWTLFLNGFIGFQWAEDGTLKSLWFFRITGLAFAALSFMIAYGTFTNSFGLQSSSPIVLFAMHFLINLVFLIIYIILQIILVLNSLDDMWPLGDLFFGVLFFVLGQVFIWVLSIPICRQVQHYIDGLFLGTLFSLLSVMMVYKYWDSITKEDLEFSVGGRMNVWEVRQLLLDDKTKSEPKGEL